MAADSVSCSKYTTLLFIAIRVSLNFVGSGHKRSNAYRRCSFILFIKECMGHRYGSCSFLFLVKYRLCTFSECPTPKQPCLKTGGNINTQSIGATRGGAANKARCYNTDVDVRGTHTSEERNRTARIADEGNRPSYLKLSRRRIKETRSVAPRNYYAG